MTSTPFCFVSPTKADGAVLGTLTLGRLPAARFDSAHLQKLSREKWIQQLPISWTFTQPRDGFVDLEITGPIVKTGDEDDFSVILRTMHALMSDAEKE